MTDLKDIDGIDASLVELLETAGFQSSDDLSAVSAAYLQRELEKANTMLQIVSEVPSLQVLEPWLGSVGEGDLVKPVDNSAQQVAEVSAPSLSSADKVPVAQPLSEKFVSEHAIQLDTLPRVKEVEAAPLPQEERVDAVQRAVRPQPREKRELEERKAKFDADKVKTFDEFRQNGGAAMPLNRDGKTDLTKAPLPEVNEGIDPSSKRYLRGVLHKDAARTKVGAIVFLICVLLLSCAILPVGYVLLNPEQWTWVLLTPALLVGAGVLYLSSATRAVCPVCRQKQFSPKACRKHVKAHSMPLLGHMIPTALHMLAYKWFRCIFCGTSIRIKE